MNNLTANQLEIRPATVSDVDVIHTLLKNYSDAGNLLPRSAIDIRNNLSEFYIASNEHQTIACGALEVFTHELGEVRSLAVSQDFTRSGLGTIIVEHIIQEARDRGLKRLMALTYAPKFFHRLGFETVAKEVLPEKVWGVCIKCYRFQRCDEIAVLLEL